MTKVIKMENYLSIGELASRTGVGVHTLRMWEKRYGSPHSQRLDSGHRRYPKEEVPRLRAIANALESGYRASKVVTATLEELKVLMGLNPLINYKSAASDMEQNQHTSNELLIEQWVQGLHIYDDDSLINGFHDQWNRHGALNFILNFAVPLLARVGKGWQAGELCISHEHFASECLVSFLSEKWRQLNIRKQGPKVLITTLPGESYSLGILMCAVVTSVTSSKVIYLGVDNPVEEIIDSAEDHMPEIISISISHVFDPDTAGDLLFKVRSQLNPKTLMITGGNGSPNNIKGVIRIPYFEDYYGFMTNYIQSGQTKI